MLTDTNRLRAPGFGPPVSLAAESGAGLAWLLEGDESAFVPHSLAATSIVAASDLTLIECDRVLYRAAARGELAEAEAADRRAYLASAAAHWHLIRIGPKLWAARDSRSPAIRSARSSHSSGLGLRGAERRRGARAPEPR